MNRVKLTVTMQLLSDTILGSGYSVPGGEDIAVCKDAMGYPYMKGSTFKGLLRESMQNWLSWTGDAAERLSELMGEESRDAAEEGRRLHVTALTLKDKPELPEDCYSLRAFTAVEDGIAKEGSLRSAACIRMGFIFYGEIDCAKEDAELVQNAARAIQYVGTMRSRGFGSVRIFCEKSEQEMKKTTVAPTKIIRYRLYAESPLLLTEASRSHENYIETKGYIPGSAVRGMVMGLLAQKEPVWFAENKHKLLQKEVRFLDAMPVKNHLAVIPAIKGFYEDKAETDFMSVLHDGEITPGYKRAKTGTFCGIEGNTLHYWTAETSAAMRIHRGKKEIFQTRYLCEGQTFEGYILLEDEKIAPRIAEMFSEIVWIGADRYEGFGKCRVTLLEAVQEKVYVTAYGYAKAEEVGKTLYLLAVSPFTMLNDTGEPCGLNEKELARALQVNHVKVEYCSTSIAEHSTYNSTWQCCNPSEQMYESGSIFKLICDEIPSYESLCRLQREGIGIRREEGCGNVLFLRADLFEGISGKQSVKSETAKTAERRELRREKYRWIMEQCKEGTWLAGLSKSQVGAIQSLCEDAVFQKKGLAELNAFLEKNLYERGAAHGAKYKEMDKFIKAVMDAELSFAADEGEKLKLLCQTFDFSRKEKEEKKEESE